MDMEHGQITKEMVAVYVPYLDCHPLGKSVQKEVGGRPYDADLGMMLRSIHMTSSYDDHHNPMYCS